MAYPENTINDIKNSLSPEQLELLRVILLLNGMEKIIRDQILAPRDLLFSGESSVTILPLSKAEHLLTIYCNNKDAFNSKQLLLKI